MKLLLASLLIFGSLGLINAANTRKYKPSVITHAALKSTTECSSTCMEITLPIFSGRPEPTWKITPKDPAYEDIASLYKGKKLYTSDHIPPTFGYKGFLVNMGSMKEPALVLGPETKDIQQLLLKSMPEKEISQELRESIGKEIASGKIKPAKPDDGPLVEPTCDKDSSRPAKRTVRFNWFTKFIWNNRLVRPRNNCYNYAVGQMTWGFGVPGLGGGDQHVALAQGIDRQMVIDAAVADGLRVVQDANAPLAPNERLVALYMWGSIDFHWFRRDRDGTWSHKPGSTPAINTNYFTGVLLGNTLDQKYQSYDFAAYMVSDNNVNIDSS